MTKIGFENNALLISGETATVEPAHAMIYRTDDLTGIGTESWVATEMTGGSIDKVNITHDTGSNPDRIAVDLAGTYRVSYMINAVCDTSTHTTSARVVKNGSTEIIGSGTTAAADSGWAFTLATTFDVVLAANDYLTIQGKVDLNTSQWNTGTLFDTNNSVTLTITRTND